ncbi:MAG: copper ion binding protein [bacterium]
MEHVKEAKITIPITDMSCAACASKIERALQKAPGVNIATVNLATGKAAVVFNPAQTGREQLVTVIKNTGYQVKEEAQTQKTTLNLKDMNCAACAQKIEKALRNTSGVVEATVNFAAGKAYITHDPGVIQADALVQVVVTAGYRADLEQEGAGELDDDLAHLQAAAVKMWWAWGFYHSHHVVDAARNVHA